MRSIHLANEQKRDANLTLVPLPKKTGIEYVLADGTQRTNVNILKTTLAQSLPLLLEQYGSLENLASALIDADPEIDIEKVGMLLQNTKKLYLSSEHKILYGVDLLEISTGPDGQEKKREYYSKTPANVNHEIPISCTNKLIPKEKAIKMFVFSSKYQIKHVNGLTYDFLFKIAQKLNDSNSLMLVGGGKKGLDPLVLYEGGTPYRAFLEGRVKNDTYCLILHLTNLELRGVNPES